MLRPEVNRREFLKIPAGAGAALAMPAPEYHGARSTNNPWLGYRWAQFRSWMRARKEFWMCCKNAGA